MAIRSLSFFPIFSALLFSSCVDKFVAPSWDVELNVPVIRKDYTLLDVVKKDTTYLKSGSNFQIYYADNRTINAIKVDKQLTLSPIETTSKVSLDTIAMTSPAATIISLTPPTWPPAIGTFPIAETKIALPVSIPTMTTFENATFDSGTLSVNIANNNGSDLSIRIDSLQIVDNRSGQNGILVRSNDVITVAPGGNGTISMNLANKTLYNQLKGVIYVYTPAKASVTIPTNANTKITLTFSNLNPSSVKSQIPDQPTKSVAGSFTLDAQSSFDTIRISDGAMKFTLTNYFNVAMKGVLTINSLRTSSNVAFTTNINLAANSSQEIPIASLQNWSITSPSISNQLSYNVDFSVLGSGTNNVSVSKKDSVVVKVHMDQLTLKSIHGKIKPTALNFDTTRVTINLDNLKNLTAEQIHFSNFSIVLKIASSANVKLGFQGTITGKNSKGNSAALTIPATVISGGGAFSNITINPTELDNFFNTFASTGLPNQLILNYSGTLNPNPLVTDPAVGITSSDSLFGSAIINSPISVEVVAGKLSDTSSINIQESSRSDIDKIQSATIALELTNGVGAGLSFYGRLENSAGDSLMAFPPKHDSNPYPLKIAAANVGSDGLVTSPAFTKVEIKLTGAELQSFLNSKRIRYTLQLDTSAPPASVKFFTSDAIKVYAAGQLNYRISK